MEQNLKIDRNYLHEMYNETAVWTGIDGVETYESWLERQLISRIQKENESNPSNNSKPCFEDWLKTFEISESGKYIYNDNHYSKLAMLEIYNTYYFEN